MNHTDHDMQAAQPAAPQNESLMDILRRRYALGEINQTQFEEMKRALGLSDGVAMQMASGGYEAH